MQILRLTTPNLHPGTQVRLGPLFAPHEQSPKISRRSLDCARDYSVMVMNMLGDIGVLTVLVSGVLETGR